MNQYMDDAARTVGDTFFPELVPYNVFAKLLALRLAMNAEIDAVKKALFYGKQTETLERVKNKYAEGLHSEPFDGWMNVDPEMVHALLGLDSESGELLELLFKQCEIEGDVNTPKLMDESGDVLWYLALLFRYLGTTFEDVGDLNIRKLAARYPEKFTTSLAIHRNEAAENHVFQ